MPDGVNDIYAHCLAVTGDPALAAEACRTALRRGGRSRNHRLAHARHEALERAAMVAPPALDVVPADLAELGLMLAATRPPVERAVLDLDARVDRTTLGRTLGIPAAQASALVMDTAIGWEAELDPAVVAYLGAADCEGLEAVLADNPSRTVRDLLVVAPTVGAHGRTCEVCTDRVRAMVSVRTLFTQAPTVDAPGDVAATVSSPRFTLPHPPPPPLGGRRAGPRRHHVMAVATAAIVLAGASLVVVDRVGDGAAGPAASTAPQLAQALSATGLELVPAVVAPTAGSVVLVSHVDEAITWEASANVEWLQVNPTSGVLEPGERAVLRLVVHPNAPEGDVGATVFVEADDGSATAARVAGTLERPPDIDAVAVGCTVRATIEDESPGNATLHFGDPAAVRAMARLKDGSFVGTLPESAAGTPWWVTGYDGRGNSARTPERELPPACGRG